MAFIKIWVHTVFSTKNRHPYLAGEIKTKVIAHIKENAKTKGVFIDTIGGYHEHLHCLISLGSDQSIDKVMQLIKGECSNWINKNNITKLKFEWGDEYFAASVSESMVDTVRKYIQNQEAHHAKKTFLEEYNEFISKYKFAELG